MCSISGKILLFALCAAAGCLAIDAIRAQHYSSQKYYQQPQDYYYPEDHVIAVKKPLREHEKPQDLSKIPGVPGVDYPTYHSVPHTSFHCGAVPVHPGMYANVETGCQAYHTCHDGREGDQGASFLCTNGTLFNQEIFACDWWYNVDCDKAHSLYSLNADPEKNPFTPKHKPEDDLKKPIYADYY